MTSPRVSVVVSCFNLGRYLDEAVDSILAQSFTDFEILIVDDASTDRETCEILSQYRKPRTRVIISAENRGLPATKNLGLANTSGEYVCMLDADDRLEPTMLERSVATLDADPACAFVSHWVRRFGDESWDWTPTDCEFPGLLDRNTLNGAALVRRRLLESAGGFDEAFREGCEDWDLWITLVERGFHGRILPEVLFNYRRRAGSMSMEMVGSPGHPALYRRLADKHRDTFRAHLPALLARREKDAAALRLQVHDLELEHHRWLAPEVAKQREDVAMLERRVRRLEGKLPLERGHFGHESEYAALRAALSNANAEVDAFRRSLSWRMTAPLRFLYEALRPSSKRNPPS